MELSGKVISVLEPQKFVSGRNGNTYVRHTFVIECGGDYVKRVAFSVLGDEKFAGMGIVVGKSYQVSFDVSSREWNGKWFTECSAWKCVCLDGGVVNAHANNTNIASERVVQSQSSSSVVVDSVGRKSDDLPF